MRPALKGLPGRGRLFAAVAAPAAAFTAVATATVAAPAAAATAAVTAAATTTSPATPAAPPVTAAAATTPAPAITERAGSALFARTGDVDRQGAALEFMAVELFDGFLGLVAVRHRNERKATGTTGEFVEDDLNDADGADLAKQGLEVLGGASEGKVPHVELTVFHLMMRADAVPYRPSPKLGFQIITEHCAHLTIFRSDRI
jgi:hypothetical protein